MKIRWNFRPLNIICDGLVFCGCSARRCAIFIVVLSAIYLLYQWNVVCSNRDVVNALSELCVGVEEGVVHGNLCQEICVDHSLAPLKCQAWHGGKEIVFKASFRGNPVFVKGRRLSGNLNSEESLFWTDDQGVEHYPSFDEFKEILRLHLHHNFNLSYSENSLKKLWPLPLANVEFSNENETLLRGSLSTIWDLVQDPEYVMVALLQHLDVFPELYGTCGGMYVVEEVDPLDLPSFLEKTSFSAWAARAKLALNILDLVEELDTMFDTPVHLCDMKPEHFGISAHHRIKFNDVDNVYLKPIVDRTVGDGSECKKHSDCDFFDCKGQCNLLKKKCLGGVTNNNLQIICQKVFLGSSFGFKSLGGTGLLASRHGEKVLKPLLEACANPSGAKDDVRLAADSSHVTKLRRALKEIVSFDERLKEDYNL